MNITEICWGLKNDGGDREKYDTWKEPSIKETHTKTKALEPLHKHRGVKKKKKKKLSITRLGKGTSITEVPLPIHIF